MTGFADTAGTIRSVNCMRSSAALLHLTESGIRHLFFAGILRSSWAETAEQLHCQACELERQANEMELRALMRKQ